MSESIKNINKLIAALKGLDKKNPDYEKDLAELLVECREVFEKIKRLTDFEVGNLKKTIKILESLPWEIREKDIEKLEVKTEEVKSNLDKAKLDELIEAHEKAQSKEEKEVIAKEIYKRTGKKDVEQFIKTRQEIEKRNSEELNKLSSELREEISKDLSKIDEKEPEKIREIIDRTVFKKEINEKELTKTLKNNSKTKSETEKVLETISEVRCKIGVESRADEIAEITYAKLKFDNVPVSKEIKNKIREGILKSWKENTEFDPQGLVENQGKITIVEAVKAAEKYKEENLEKIINYRAIKLEEEIGYHLRNNGIENESLISRYASAVNELTNNSQYATEEISRDKIYHFVETIESERSPGEIERSINESEFTRKSLAMPWQKWNNAIDNYRRVSNEIGNLAGKDKLPKLKEVTVLEKMAELFKEGSTARKWINSTQRFVHFIENVNSFPGNILVKLGVRDFGFKILGKIGGQAAVDFAQNSAAILAKKGTFNGLWSIFKGLMSKGAVTAGTSAAEGAAAGTAAGAAAGGAGGLATAPIPVVGWVIAAVTALAIILKPVFNKIKNWAKENINLNFGAVGDFFSKTLNLGTGGIVALGGGVVSMMAAMPVIISQLAGIIGPVMLFFILGSVAYSVLQQNMLSTLVPPRDMGNCVLKSEYFGNINCDSNAPENNMASLKKDNYIRLANAWEAGVNFSSTCYNDVVNRSLCAGINPAYSLWMWLNESGASNYSSDDIEDFGIHFIKENKNFNAQITKFLTLNPASACINDPRIGGNYWLALGANFMNGSDCNPDRPNSIFKSATPRKWLADFEKYWGDITSDPIPSSIFVPNAGKNCDQIGIGTTYPGNAVEHTDADGNVWVCTETTQSPGENYDPNTPGLIGVPVEGECSVGEVVVPTKQCDPQWGQIHLNGGACANGSPGTICSAGCGPTSVSMMMRKVNGSLTPNNIIFGSGSAYYNMGCEGSSLEQAKTELTKKFGGGAITYNAATQGCDERAIGKWICEGKVVMVLANFYRNSDLDLGGHYVLAVGVKNGKIVVRDPYYDVTETPFDGTVAYGYAHDIRSCLLVDKEAVK